MPPDLASLIARVEANALLVGLGFQVVACLMNSSEFHKLQIGIGLIGVVLMVIGFHQLAR